MGVLVAAVAMTHNLRIYWNGPAADEPSRQDVAAIFGELRRIVGEARPDRLIVIANDHLDNFFLDKMPQFCVGWLGLQAKIVIVWLTAVFPIIINTYAGVLNADRDLIEAARSFGATRGQVFRRIMLPCALPYIIAGLRIGASLAIIGTVVAELYTALSGLGELLAEYGNTFQTAKYFVPVIVPDLGLPM
jgi:ABC-type proline/glycine betaine transport system permease subunit